VPICRPFPPSRSAFVTGSCGGVRAIPSCSRLRPRLRTAGINQARIRCSRRCGRPRVSRSRFACDFTNDEVAQLPSLCGAVPWSRTAPDPSHRGPDGGLEPPTQAPVLCRERLPNIVDAHEGSGGPGGFQFLWQLVGCATQ
jgi:hypothetical protein